MSTRPARLLVCAFGPFPGVPVNPSQRAVADLLRLRRPALGGLDIEVEILPTRWDALSRLDALLERRVPDGVILFGVAARRRWVSVETLAVNAARALPDAARRPPPGRRLLAGAPDALGATMPAGPLLAALRAGGVPAATSRDAGRYLCNAGLLHALAWARRRRDAGGPPPAVFIHLPGRSGRPRGVSRAGMARALSALVVAFAAAVRHRRQAR
ncbi:peptidase C15 [Xanthobacter dioxanivorans]|uniref:Pyrrolidone-carboxylate peptidase n=1 Tax=Xanthobacter dioxanivorans TaxID=2528964 RepID=A0A974PSL6_9HYPH|nr:peptidase C15 [Xanthobacter dioxanivorans]QRG08523.1 peptidase C15 [Xanthobacter dioxanivorans]